MDSIIINGIELRPIPVSPNDCYMAGSDGNIYSCTRYAGFGRKERCDWYALTPARGKRNYASVSLCHENKRVTKNIHRLVCMAFHGMPPSPQHQVRHLDGNPANNAPGNLAWGTQSENWQDRKAHGHGIDGERHHCSKLTDIERSHIRWVVARGMCSRRHVARVLGMSFSAVQSICESSNMESNP